MKNDGNKRLALCILDSEDNILAVGKEWVGGYTEEACEDIRYYHGLDLLKEVSMALAQEFQSHDLPSQIETLLREAHDL